MNNQPKPSAHGQTAEFHRKLYRALRKDGYGEPDILRLSLSKALVLRYGSPEAVDHIIGAGTHQGVKQRLGGLSAWRVAWNRVKNQERRRYAAEVTALDLLNKGLEACLGANVSHLKIWSAFDKVLAKAPSRRAS